MIGWIVKLCVLCSMSALMQLMLQKDSAREAVGMIFGLLMLHMTCESAAALLHQLSESRDLMEIFSYLMK